MKKPGRYHWAIVLVLFLLPGCASEQPNDAGYLTVRLKQNPSTLDPALIVDLDGARIAAKIYSGLVCFDDQLSPVPDLASSWSVSPDGLRYTFTLQRGVTFCNGREVTSEDVVYSFQRVLDPVTRSPRTWVLSHIEGARDFMSGRSGHVSGLRAEGRYRVSMKLEAPFAPFISMLGLTTAYVVPREEVERWGDDFGFHGSGTGPFMLEQWQHNQFLRLKARRDYYGPKALLEGVCYKIIPEDFTALVEFEKGDLDLLPDIMQSAYERFENDPDRKGFIHRAPGLNTYYLGLNCQTPPFDDPRVRRALNHAIDRTTMLATLLKGRGRPARGPLPPILQGGTPVQGYVYDPDQARRLLREAGYPQGFSMTIYQTADMETLDICQVIQHYLSAVGIEVSIIQLEWSTFLDTVAQGRAQAFWLSWWADYPDGENFLAPLFHSRNWGAGGNRCRFRDEVVDARIDEAVTIIDDSLRRARYRRIEKRIVRQAPWVFFWHKSVCSISQPWVGGYDAVPLAVMEKWNRIEKTRYKAAPDNSQYSRGPSQASRRR